ncbi:glycosyltransferase family 2 protein [Methanobacterium petrolearium]|uniref:glycosyltransferase family 2 protein n=1 Tax=Methanobacterium petrolearium TaxID=710190 RepID=UPI001AE4AC04|nr:glycosyltransferase family A protein [Methanobacterium petrolearium]MBP1945470.1 glycosyltransferase involved in cell wall biosynthesis [Methanobacterium petrolearium]BDZ71676.1 hypothetical protein GCM10025861_21930 [Methanobacterium petrolearium]
MNYVLITPLKDEEKNIHTLKETVFNQTKRPVCWVIVDSGSEDNTFYLLNELAKEYDWIIVTKQKVFFENGYGHLNFSEAINEGYELLKKTCIDYNIKYSLIGKTDATPILSEDYFEILSKEMINDGKLAITCGIQKLVRNGNEFIIKKSYNNILSNFNDIRLYRVDFFEKFGGYPLAPSPDTILLIKALNRGWNVKVVNKTYFRKNRLGGSKIGVWEGSKLKGRYMYILGYHPLIAMLNAFENSRKIPPYYQFLPMLLGFLLATLKHEEKFHDKEIREYYGKNRLKQIIKYFKR